MISKRLVLLSILAIIILPLFSQGAQEIQALVDSVESGNIENLMKSIHVLELRIESIDREYDQIWGLRKAEIESSYALESTRLANIKPEIWETDREFQQRIAHEEEKLSQRIERDILEARTLALEKRISAKEPFTELLETASRNLMKPRSLENDYFAVRPQEYQRNERKWPVMIDCTHPIISFKNLEIVIDFEELIEASGSSRDVRKEIVDFDDALRTGKLSSNGIWKVSKSDNCFVVGISEIIVINLLNNISYVFKFPDELLARAFQVEGESIENAQVRRISAVKDMQPLFPQELDATLPIVLPFDFSPFILDAWTLQIPMEVASSIFSITPENTIERTLTIHAEEPIFATHYGDEKFLSHLKPGDYSLTIKTMDGLFEKIVPISIINSTILDSTSKPYHFPDTNQTPLEDKIKRTSQLNKPRGFGIGISTGYPSISFDFGYTFTDLQILLNYGFSFETELKIGFGLLYNIAELKIDDLPFIFNIGFRVANSTNDTSNFLYYYMHLGTLSYITTIPLEFFIRYLPGIEVEIVGDDSAVRYASETAIGCMYYF